MFQVTPGAKFEYKHYENTKTAEVKSICVFVNPDGSLYTNVVYLVDSREVSDSIEHFGINLGAVDARQIVCPDLV